MLRYYQRVTNAQIKHGKGIKSSTTSFAGPPKKYDKALLPCSVKGCCEDFLVSNASKRFCEEHWNKRNEPSEKDKKWQLVLDILNK